MFSKPNVIVYVRRAGLIVAGKRIAPARFNFLPTAINNLEVIDKAKFVDGCQRFLSEHGVHGKRALIVLDASIVFTKTIELDKSGKPSLLVQAFVQAMPFDTGKRACLALRRDEQLDIFATNADLYKAISEALRAAGVSKLLAITPADAYALDSGDQLGAAFKQFIADTTVCAKANFATVSAV